jgi:hypothetical protein
MATFNQNQNKYYTWAAPSAPNPNPTSTFVFGQQQPQNKLFGQTQPTTTWGQKPTSASSWSNQPIVQKPFSFTTLPTTTSFFEAPKAPLFGSTNLEAPKAPLFGSTNLEAPKAPLFGSTNLEAPKAPLFGSPKLYDMSTNLYNVASNLTLVPLDLPVKKIEGLIFMVSLDQKNTLASTSSLLENVFNPSIKFSSENMWFTSLVKYSDEKFALEKVNETMVSFALLYSSLLRELMVETIHTPEELYTWLIDFAMTQKNKKMLWLFTILKYAGVNKFHDILDMTNELEVFVWALQSFIRFDNNPRQAVETAQQSTNQLFKTFLLSMVGASYGKEFYPTISLNNDMTNLITKFK